MERGSKTRLITALVLAVVFGAGLMVGLAADGSLAARPADDVAVAADERRESTARRTPMYQQVEPSEAQMALIDSIVRDFRAQNRELREEFDAEFTPRYQALIQETRQAIKDVFTPEQALRYQELLDERDRRRAEREAEKKDRD